MRSEKSPAIGNRASIRRVILTMMFNEDPSNQGASMWQGSYKFHVTQWGVGHGGFHSQSIFFQPLDRLPTRPTGDGSQVRVIYDCGSGRMPTPRTALKSAVRQMLLDVQRKSTIDLLVISHFDKDHVNGLEFLAAELGTKNIRVAMVWAPMLTKIEALYAIADSDLSGAALQRYANLVYDPVGTLTELLPDTEVNLIVPNTETIPLTTNDIDTNVPETDGSDITLTTAPGSQGLIARPSTTQIGEALWELQPYVIRSTLAGSSSISTKVSSLLGKPIADCDLDDLLKITNNKALLAKFHSAVRQHHMQQLPKTRTSSARTGSNLSSLCVYSGPVSPYDWCRFRGGWNPLSLTPSAVPIAPAWLGTADAGLLDSHHVDAMRMALTQSRLDRVGVSSAPHHGSEKDSGADLWNAMPNLRQITIEAKNTKGGVGNHHPNTVVLNELASRNLNVHIAYDGNHFNWVDKRIR